MPCYRDQVLVTRLCTSCRGAPATRRAPMRSGIPQKDGKKKPMNCLSLGYHGYLYEGLNGVNRQPSNGLKINRQPSKTEYFYRQPSNERAKISRQNSQISLDDRDRLTKAPSTLTRFQTKTFAPFSKRFASTLTVFVSFSLIHTTTPNPF